MKWKEKIPIVIVILFIGTCSLLEPQYPKSRYALFHDKTYHLKVKSIRNFNRGTLIANEEYILPYCGYKGRKMDIYREDSLVINIDEELLKIYRKMDTITCKSVGYFYQKPHHIRTSDIK